ncbi:CCKAR [Mytilus edulis]|uniref:CCKAR n=1 Tax=Mytilus edulis TaxID=6550 RepID=A0A8S3USJ2_MYTED|nr:CCKAR [Mytilus edulis]
MPSLMQNSSVEDVLQQYTQNVTVNVVLLSLYLVTGVLGNTIVLLVYKLKMKVTSEERYFIPVLALSDLVSSTVCSLYGIIVNNMPVTLESELAWDLLLYINGCVSFMSIQLLLCIALQRYLKICKQKTLCLKKRRIMVGLSCIFAVTFALPLAFSYDIDDFAIEGKVIGKLPIKIRFESNAACIANGVAASVFVICMYSSFMSLYGKVGCTLYGHIKAQNIKRKIVRFSKRIRFSRSMKRSIEYSVESATAFSTAKTKNTSEEEEKMSKIITTLKSIDERINLGENDAEQKEVQKTKNKCEYTDLIIFEAENTKQINNQNDSSKPQMKTDYTSCSPHKKKPTNEKQVYINVYANYLRISALLFTSSSRPYVGRNIYRLLEKSIDVRLYSHVVDLSYTRH